MTDRMTTQEIVKADCERYGFDYESFYRDLHGAIKSGKWRILRHGNTLLLYELTGPHMADMHIITADTVPKLVLALREFDRGMRAAGFTHRTANIAGDSLLPVLRRAKIPFTATPAQEVVDGKVVTGYNLEFK
jgi:hypothetical protein